MIAGTNSGCGKTTVTCAVLQALVNRKINVSSFKCGPDYIDPMFHKTVIGTAAYNLDTYLMSNDTVNYLLNKNSGDIAVSYTHLDVYKRQPIYFEHYQRHIVNVKS